MLYRPSAPLSLQNGEPPVARQQTRQQPHARLRIASRGLSSASQLDDRVGRDMWRDGNGGHRAFIFRMTACI